MAVFFRPADQLAIDQLALSHCTGRVLDIGAGTGIHSLYLQNQGLEITALDVSAHACQILSKSGISNVVEGDVFDVIFPYRYNTWLLLGRSIGAVGNLDQLTNFFCMAKQWLVDEGNILLNSTNGENRAPKVRTLVFEYRGQSGMPLEWLDIDQESLTELAFESDFQTKILHVEDDGNYLAQVTKNNSV